MLDIQAYYFQSVAPPQLLKCTNVPEKTKYWYVLDEVDGIDNSGSGAVDFTFDMKNLNLQPNATTSAKDFTEQAYFDGYWQPSPITVPAGRKFDKTKVHQVQLFLMDLGSQPNLANTATPDANVPGVLYPPSSGTGVFFSPKPRALWAGAEATSAIWNPLNYTDVPVTESGPC